MSLSMPDDIRLDQDLPVDEAVSKYCAGKYLPHIRNLIVLKFNHISYQKLKNGLTFIIKTGSAQTTKIPAVRTLFP